MNESKETNNSSGEDFFCENGLKKRKDIVLKTKLEGAVNSLAISKREFYLRGKITPQYWWRLSWGIDKIPLWLKKHFFREFGDAFAFLFCEGLEDEE